MCIARSVSDRNVGHVILDFTDYQETAKRFLFFLSFTLSFFFSGGGNLKSLNFEARSIFFHFELLRHLLINLNTKQNSYTEGKPLCSYIYEDKTRAVNKMAQIPIFQKQHYFNVQDFKELVFYYYIFKFFGVLFYFVSFFNHSLSPPPKKIK